ncbi:MAG: AAA family ATPase [Rhodocyclaceae bacterium]|nr:AAA family ATPase [Rhodocyclaceae bacterium]
MARSEALTAALLRKRCDPERLRFERSSELPDLIGGLGQERAEEALRFALSMRQPGYHVFVLGETGTGRHATVSRVLSEFADGAPVPPDLCYVHNFAEPLRPRLLRLPAGMGARLRARMQQLLREVGPAVSAALEADVHRSRVKALQDAHKAREENAILELGRACEADGLCLLRTAEGYVFAPAEKGEPLAPDDYANLSGSAKEKIEKAVVAWSDRLEDALRAFPGWRRSLRESIGAAIRAALLPAVDHLLHPAENEFADYPGVVAFLAAVRDDLLETGEDWRDPGEDEEDLDTDGSEIRFHRYQVNLLVDHSSSTGAPVVTEDNPVFGNLIGRIEHLAQMGALVTNYNLVRAGALQRANGGYLVIDANRLFSHSYAWEGLKRALRSREIRIEPPAEAQGWGGALTLEPEPVPCDLKVVLLGDRDIFYLLNENDPDFPELFKVAADFEDDIPRSVHTEYELARLLATLARGNGLREFDRAAVARLIEESSRLADDGARLSLQTRQMADLMRESDYCADLAGAELVGVAHVDAARQARRRRFDRFPSKVRESILDGTVLIATDGSQAGQVNGLVVVELAGEQFGHPMRITATARLGDGDLVDIERETELGGALHSKGVLILSAFLAARYARHQPLSLTASLVFEQSYAPVEGDSASLAELCALLSALADIPIRQALAITGSVNQFGAVQAIGGVNEKIEGFFDLCAARGLVGGQGVVIPAANVRHLMLREDVVAAAAEGRFTVYAVTSVDEAMEVLTGLPAGTADAKGIMPTGSINQRVAAALADMAAARHSYSMGEGGARKPRRRSE